MLRSSLSRLLFGSTPLRTCQKRFITSSRSESPDIQKWMGILFPKKEPKPKPIKVKPYPRAMIRSIVHFMGPSQNNLFYSCDAFALLVQPYPSYAVPGPDGMVGRPPWLPWPASPATHEKRHLSPPHLSFETSSLSGSERWEAKPLAPSVKTPSPTLHVMVFSTKKKIHKLAVIRHRVRTKLTSALQQAINSPGLPTPKPGVYVIHAKPDSYSSPSNILVERMKQAHLRLSGISEPKPPRRPSFPPKKPPPPRKKKPIQPFTLSGYL